MGIDRHDWMARNPWALTVAKYALAIAIGIAIGQAFRNNDVIGEVTGDYHWRYTHQLETATPAEVAPNKKE